MPILRTLARAVRHEIPKIRGSRFIASVAKADSATAALALVEGVREEFKDATHNCFAWRVGTGDGEARSSDDGEPSGTAGRPILQEIDGRRLEGVVVVVTRYYGGTKLGTGGLVRAYGEAAAAALDLAGVVEVPVVETLRLRHDYDETGAVLAVLSAHGLEPVASDYGARVRLELAVPIETVETVRRDLVDATRGRAVFDET